MDILTFTPRQPRPKPTRSFPQNMRKPTIEHQKSRLAPRFEALQNAFQTQNIGVLPIISSGSTSRENLKARKTMW